MVKLLVVLLPSWAISLQTFRRPRNARIRHPQGWEFSAEADLQGKSAGTSPEENSTEGMSLDGAAGAAGWQR